MTAQPVGPGNRRPWSPDPVRQRSAGELVLAKPFEIRLRVRDVAP
ncbi:hypothetical protein [Plantactinospora sp. CA-290183]